MSVVPSTARPPLPQLGTHAAFPGLCELPDGRLLHVWRDGPSHTGGGNGRVVAAYLTRSLRPIGAPWVILDWAKDCRVGGSVVCRSDGTVELAIFTYDTPSAPACAVWIGSSADQGLTFTGWTRIAPDAPTLAVSGPLVELPDGTLLLSAYGRLTDKTFPDGSFAFRRVGGVWQPPTRIAYDGIRDYQEPWIIELRSGAVLAAYRWSNRDKIAIGASHDGGVTWSEPTAKFDGWGQATLLELATGPTVCIYRRDSAWPCPAVYRVSDNRGGTWGPELLLAAAPSQMTYAALVETSPGLAAGTLGIESDAQHSTITALHLLDTP